MCLAWCFRWTSRSTSPRCPAAWAAAFSPHRATQGSPREPPGSPRWCAEAATSARTVCGVNTGWGRAAPPTVMGPAPVGAAAPSGDGLRMAKAHAPAKRAAGRACGGEDAFKVTSHLDTKGRESGHLRRSQICCPVLFTFARISEKESWRGNQRTVGLNNNNKSSFYPFHMVPRRGPLNPPCRLLRRRMTELSRAGCAHVRRGEDSSRCAHVCVSTRKNRKTSQPSSHAGPVL